MIDQSLRYVPTTAAAEMLGVSVWTVHRLVRSGRLTAIHLGGSNGYRVSFRSLLAYEVNRAVNQ